MRVSPLALGTMTFGSDWGWGADDAEARRIFEAYVDRGGNFVDTSVNYTNGASERIVGHLLKGRRERMVLSTKYTMARNPAVRNTRRNGSSVTSRLPATCESACRFAARASRGLHVALGYAGAGSASSSAQAVRGAGRNA